jgi:hypothetical protein
VYGDPLKPNGIGSRSEFGSAAGVAVMFGLGIPFVLMFDLRDSSGAIISREQAEVKSFFLTK